MRSSRRSFLRNLGIGTAAGAVVQWPFSSALVILEPPKRKEPGGPVLLNSNENAYGPSEKVRQAIGAALNRANRYPFGEYGGLVDRIADLHRVKPEQVILGCGSTEILRVACCAFLGPGKQLVQASPTFEAIEAYARVAGAQIASLPLNREFAHDLDGMLRRANEGTSLAYICNPNNPSGSLTPRKDLESFIAKLSKNSYVLIDEAYHHYAGDSATYQSFLDHPVDDERVIVCRTFSKVYALAGLRIGYGIAHPAAAKKMRTYLSEANINQFAVQAAVAAIEDNAGLQTSVKRNANDRQEFFNQAMARMLKPVDSHANFVFMNVHHPAGEVIRHFRENNILIGRQFPPLDTYIRISLGLPSEMQAFWQVWDRLPFAIAPMSH